MARICSHFFSRPIILLKISGLWLPPDKYVILYNILTVLFICVHYSYAMFNVIYIVLEWGNFEAVAEASYLFFTQITFCVKATVFIVKRDEFKNLLHFMESDIFEPLTEKQKKSTLELADKIQRIFLFFIIIAIVTCAEWVLMPLIDNPGVRRFPFKIWMPVGPESTPGFVLGNLYQAATVSSSPLMCMAIDSVTLSMLMFGCAELDFIKDKFEKIVNVRLSTGQNISKYKSLLNANNKQFINCIRQHQHVVKFIELVENMFHVNTFVQLCSTVAIICVIGLQIASIPSGSILFMSSLNYLMIILSQLFIYCWCGNELTTRSEDLRNHLYISPWHEQSVQFRSSMGIAMTRFLKPIQFRAGQYIPLSRPAFVNILRLSYTYFAFLHQSKNK